jgi:hypothetical protein
MGPSPVDRAKTRAEHHVITEGHGIPLAVSLARIDQAHGDDTRSALAGEKPAPPTPGRPLALPAGEPCPGTVCRALLLEPRHVPDGPRNLVL